MSLYRETLKQCDIEEGWKFLNREDWQPGEGDYLGPLHYRYVIKNLFDSYQNSISGNDNRRGKALLITKKITPSFIDSNIKNFPGLEGERFVDLFVFDQLNISDDLDKEHLNNFVRFLSLFARACRWEVRKPMTLEIFLELINDFITSSHEDMSKRDIKAALSYLLYIGEDVFAFYLMLWEVVFAANDLKQGRTHA